MMNDDMTELVKALFGGLEAYCPWDVVSYCHALKMWSSVTPQNYWGNTGGNNVIKQFVSRAKSADRNEIEYRESPVYSRISDRAGRHDAA